MKAHLRYASAMRRVALSAVISSILLIARAAPAQPSLHRTSCVSDHPEDGHLLPCLAGDSGSLTPEEREAVRAHLRDAAAARWDRVEQLLWWMFTLPDVADRALVLDLLVAHGMPRAAADAVLALGDLGATLPQLVRRAPRRERAALRTLTPSSCRLVPSSATGGEVTIRCDEFVECGPGACTETHVLLEFVASASGPRVLRAGRFEAPSGGACGCCMEEF